MLSTHWEEVKAVFEAALLLEEGEREAFVARRCGEDRLLAREVLNLLAADRESSKFLEVALLPRSGVCSSLTESRLLEVDDTLCGRFRVLAYLGEGGMGQVYKAVDLELKQQIAIKVIKPDIAEIPGVLSRFKREVNATRMVTHANVCRTFDLETHSASEGKAGEQGAPITFLTMELLIGETLAQRIDRTGPLPLEQVRIFATQIARALQAAHSAGVIHCDLKPSNIFLSGAESDPRVVVTDFGIAKLIRLPEQTPASQLTASGLPDGATVGTPFYMAPERIEGGDCSPASDLYSFGLVIYEALTAQKLSPYRRSRNEIETALSNLDSNPGDQLWTGMIARCVQPNPGDRFESVDQLLTSLEYGPSRLLANLQANRISQPMVDSREVKRSLALWKWSGLLAVLWGCFTLGVPSVRHSLLSVLPEPLRDKLSRSHPRQIRSVVLTDIRNNTGDPTFDRSIGELLATSLEQSPYLKLFPSAKLPEVLQRMNLPSGEPITALRGLEICKREGLEAEISASISRFGSGYTLVLKAVGADGNEIVSGSERSPDVAHIPNMVESGASRLRSVLGEDRLSLSRYSAPLEQVTSPSLLALTNYSDGKQRLYDGKTEDAVRYFERALELDPAFAMAREYLGISFNILNDFERSENNYLLATRLAQHVTERERLKIFGDYYLQIKDFSRAISYLKTLCEEYPLDVPAHINLGQAYLSEYRFQEAVSETKTALALQSSVGTLNNLAEIHFLAGDTAESMHITNDVLRDHPHESRALYNMARCHLVRREYAEALRYFNALIETGGNAESRGRTGLADLAMARGQYSEAESQLARGIDLDQRVDNRFSASMKILALALAYYDHGKRDKFDSAMSKLANSYQSPSVLFLMGRLYAEAHQLSAARRTLRLLRSPGDRFRTSKVYSYVHLLTADIDLSEGNYTAAIEDAREALGFDDSTLGVETLARAYRAAARVPDSVREYERVLTRTNERTEECDGLSFHSVVQADYWLATLYAKAGNVALARKYLGAFLEDSPRPDMDVPLYRDGNLLRKKLQKSATGEPTPAT